MKLTTTIILLLGFLASSVNAGRSNKENHSTMKEIEVPNKKKKVPSRHLSAVDDWDLQSIECQDVMYSLFLHVANHLVLFAIPQGDAEHCQPLAFHNGPNGKVIEVASDPRLLVSWLGESLQIENGEAFTLAELEGAFDQAADVLPDEYNVIDNNCATILFDMAHSLDLPVTDTIIDFVVGKLVEDGVVAEVARQTPKVNELDLRADETEDDYVLVESLVRHYAAEHSARR